MKNGAVPVCYLEVIAILNFIHFALSRRQFVGVGIHLAKSFHICKVSLLSIKDNKLIAVWYWHQTAVIRKFGWQVFEA